MSRSALLFLFDHQCFALDRNLLHFCQSSETQEKLRIHVDVDRGQRVHRTVCLLQLYVRQCRLASDAMAALVVDLSDVTLHSLHHWICLDLKSSLETQHLGAEYHCPVVSASSLCILRDVTLPNNIDGATSQVCRPKVRTEHVFSSLKCFLY